MKDAFAIDSPAIWMDSSTTSYCENLESQLNGPQGVADMYLYPLIFNIPLEQDPEHMKDLLQIRLQKSWMFTMMNSLIVNVFP